jgi:hypothetical protein
VYIVKGFDHRFKCTHLLINNNWLRVDIRKNNNFLEGLNKGKNDI